MRTCPECGFKGNQVAPAATVSLVADLPMTAAQLLRGAIESTVRCRPDPEVWSALEYAAHTGEAIQWYHARIRRALTEQQPQLLPFDWDAACRDGRYRDRTTSQVLADVDGSCAALAAELRSISPSNWQRCGTGSDGSTRSVAQLARRAAHEAVHHSLDIRTVLRAVQAV